MNLIETRSKEARAPEAAGADVIRIDEPWLRNDPVAAERYAIRVIERALSMA